MNLFFSNLCSKCEGTWDSSEYGVCHSCLYEIVEEIMSQTHIEQTTSCIIISLCATDPSYLTHIVPYFRKKSHVQQLIIDCCLKLTNHTQFSRVTFSKPSLNHYFTPLSRRIYLKSTDIPYEYDGDINAPSLHITHEYDNQIKTNYICTIQHH